MTYKRRALTNFALAVVGLTCCITTSAQAATLGFTGDYAISGWVIGGSKEYTFGGPEPGTLNPERWLLGDTGSVDTSGAPDKIAISAVSHGHDAPEIPSVRSTFTYTTTAVTDGEVFFDWTHAATGEAPINSFGYILNDIELVLDRVFLFPSASSGSQTFSIDAGDTFGFFAQAFDSFGGGATATISNFSVNSVPVPEPPAVGLILGAIGLLRLIRKRQT